MTLRLWNHPASQPTAKRSAAQTSVMRALRNWATRLPRRSCETVTRLCRFTAHGPFIPSLSSSVTSDGTPRIVDVIGATVTVDRYATAVSLVRTRTGLGLSGGANPYMRMSPRTILPAMLLPLPTRATLRDHAAVANSQVDPALRAPFVPAAANALEGRREPALSGSAWRDAPHDPSPARASYRAPLEWFPYADSIPQYNPQLNGPDPARNASPGKRRKIAA